MTGISRRQFASLAALAVGGSGLLSACSAARPELQPAGLTLPAPSAWTAFVTMPALVSEGLHDLNARVSDLNRQRGTHAWFGLGSRIMGLLGEPAGAPRMPSYPGDLLARERTHPDLLIQVEADDAELARPAVIELLERVPGLQVAWQTGGARPDNRPTADRPLFTNAFGFVEGQANPATTGQPSAAEVVTIRPSDGPAWAVGGSYLAVRVIQLAQAAWDADPIHVQEHMIGRRRDGHWLDGTSAAGEPDFGSDPEGLVTSLGSHVRRANPREGGSAPPLLRRSWNYATPDGESGLLFMCFQRDLRAGFEAVQERLVGQAMDAYLLTVGGGYFFVPPHGGSIDWLAGLAQSEIERE